jgi:predicted AAA+ superfamily ATPase
VPNWERFIRRIFDEEHKIYLTGSNSKLLSSELATHLTGRYIKIELFPFSFGEFLKFKKIETFPFSSDNKANILNAFDEYLFHGGFPGFQVNKDISYIQQIFDDIIYKDLIARFEIRNIKPFKQLAHYLLTNFTKEISYNSLKNTLRLSNVNTIKDYIEYLQQAYLVFECYKFDFSMRKQIVYNKKIFCIDNGLQKSIAFNFSTNHGHLLENLIYTALRRKFPHVFYYKTNQNYEVDFVVQEKEISLFQVCYSLEDEKSFEREKRALNEAMKELNLQSGTILTYNQEDTIDTGFGQINIIPAWKWLIRNDELIVE